MATINSRETYLAYRATWKAEYQELSSDIREKKALTKDGMRKGLPTGNLQNDLRSGRETARTMLEELAAVRTHAREHWARTHAKVAVTA